MDVNKLKRPVKETLRSRGMTVGDLAKELGVSRQWCSEAIHRPNRAYRLKLTIIEKLKLWEEFHEHNSQEINRDTGESQSANGQRPP